MTSLVNRTEVGSPLRSRTTPRSKRIGCSTWVGYFLLALALDLQAVRAQELVTLKGHRDTPGCVVFSPDGKTVATSGGDELIKLWETATGKEQATLDGHAAWIHSLAFSPDGKLLASGSGHRSRPTEQTVKLWDPATGAKLPPPQGRRIGYVHSVAFSPDGKVLLAGTADGIVKRWDVASRKERESFEVGAVVHALAFASDGKTLATADGLGWVKLWDVSTGKETRRFKVRGGKALSVRYAPNGKALVSTSLQGIAPN